MQVVRVEQDSAQSHGARRQSIVHIRVANVGRIGCLKPEAFERKIENRRVGFAMADQMRINQKIKVTFEYQRRQANQQSPVLGV